MQQLDEVKTTASRKHMAIASELLDELKQWRQQTEFPPILIGFLPAP